jgi:hypothetical protein
MKKEKMYIIRKYVMAESVAQAIRREPKQPVHEVFVDDDWRKANTDRLADAVGYVQMPKEQQEE